MSSCNSTVACSSKVKRNPLLEIKSAQIAETEGTDKNSYCTRYKSDRESTMRDPLYWNVSKSLLRHALIEPKLRTSDALLHFLQDIELSKAKQYLTEKQYALAAPLLENNFILLNQVYTARSTTVLLALCRLLGCCVMMPGSPNAEKWADLALHRYEGVSDGDLLELYLPLLQMCSKIWWQTGRNRDILETRLQNLKQRGIKFNESITLLEAVDTLEQKLYSIS